MDTTQSNSVLYNYWLNLNLRLLWCYDDIISHDDHPQDSIVSDTDYSNNGAWLIRKGWARVEYANNSSFAQTGQWLIVKPGKRKQSFAPDTELLSIAFDARWPDGSFLYDEGLSFVFDAYEHPNLERRALPLVKTIKRMGSHDWDTRKARTELKSFIKLQTQLFNWLAKLDEILQQHDIEHSGQTDMDERVIKVVRQINAHDLGVPLDIEQLARSVALSPTHLIRLFQQQLDKTPTQYFEGMRLEQAQKRLKMPDVRIKEVALDLGFMYLSHFSKWIKKHTGLSPRDYKKQSRNI